MERLPEELITLIWDFDGRYKKAMKDICRFLVSAPFRRMVMPSSHIMVYGNAAQRHEWFFFVQEFQTWEYERAYSAEMTERTKYYLGRMNFHTGHIKGITERPGKVIKAGPIKRFEFRDCLGRYIIQCTAKHHRLQTLYYGGVLYHSVQKYPTITVHKQPKDKVIKVTEKCGIEVLNKTWLRNARRRKEAKAYINAHMAI